MYDSYSSINDHLIHGQHLVRSFRSAPYDLESEVIPNNPSFAVCPGECRFFVTDKPQVNHSMSNQELNRVLSDFDNKILYCIGLNTYSTSRQLNQLIRMLGEQVSKNAIPNSIAKLQKYRLITVSRTRRADGGVAMFKIMSLSDQGYDFIMSKGYKGVYFHPGSINDNIAFIKQTLATNQLRNAFLSSQLPVTYAASNIVLYCKLSETEMPQLTPSMIIGIGNDSVVFAESIRSDDGWQSRLYEKLKLYKLFFDNSSSCNLIFDKPTLLLNGESEDHNRQISEIIHMLDFNHEVFYVEDLHTLGVNFEISFYELINGRRQSYRFMT